MANEFKIKNGLIVSGSATFEGGISAQAFTGSFSGTIQNATSASYADTASYALNAGDSAWTASAGNIYYSSGNVGIETTSPTYKLHISSSNNNDGLAIHYIANNSAQFPFIISSNADSAGNYVRINTNVIELKRNGGASTIKTVGSNNNLVFQSANSLVFDTNSANTRMYIDTSGNVGIGTTSPSEKLHVDGVVLSKGYIATGNYNGPASVPNTGIFSTNINFADGFGSLIVAARPDAARPIVFATYNGSAMGERMRITSAGNIGIGTTTPSYTLDVSGSGNFTNNLTVTGSTFISSSNATQLRVGNNLLFVSGSGDVGIGTTSPTARLDIVGVTSGTAFKVSGGFPGYTNQYFYVNEYGSVAIVGNTIDPNNLLFGAQGTSDTFGRIAFGFLTGVPYIGFGPGSTTRDIYLSRDNGDLKFGFTTSNTERLRIKSNGNFLIGTTTDGARLKIQGSGTTSSTTALLVQNANASSSLVVTDSSLIQIANPTFTTSTAANFTGILLSNTSEIRSNSNDPSRVAGFRLYNSSTSTGEFELYRTGVVTTKLSSGFLGSNETSFITYGNFGLGTNAPLEGKLVISSAVIRAASTSLLYVTGSTSETYELARFVSDNTARVVITNSGSVGIGTTTPSYTLDVSGSGNFTDNLTVTGSTFISSSNATQLQVGNNSLFVSSSGNVGIGTNTPTSRLQVSFPLDTPNQSIFRSDAGDNLLAVNTFATTNRMQLLLGAYNGTSTPTLASIFDADTGIQLSGNNIIRFVNGGSENVTINASGNVGIGTTAPLGRLHLTSPTGPADTLYLQFDNGGNGGKWAINPFITNVSNGGLSFVDRYASTTPFVISTSGNVGIGTINPTEKLDINGNLRVSGIITAQEFHTEFVSASIIYESGSTKFGDTSDDIHSFTGSIQQSGSDSYFLGNVGIGTATPNERLEVAGNIRLQNSGRVYLWQNNNNNYIDYANWISSTGNPQVIQNTGAGGITFKTLTNTRMFISSSGNVGIGTISPNYKLEVEGSIGVKRVGVAATSTIDMGGNFNFDAYSGYSHVFKQAGSELVRILPSGNVGIGTTSPTSKLHVVADNSTIATLESIGSNANSKTLIIQSGGDRVIFDAKQAVGGAATDLSFELGNSEVMRLANTGNVGIGTTSPTAALDVNGVILSRSGISLSTSTTTLSPGQLWFPTGGTIGISGTGGTLNILSSGQSEILSINGNVGIGTASPAGHQLDIASTQGSGTNSAIRALFPAGGGLANTEFGALASRDGVWTAVYGKQGSASSAGYFDGNVGIGTASPSNKLQVVGGVTATSFTGSFSGSITAPGSTTQVAFNSGGTLSADSGFVYSGSNVGIGTTSPTYRLDVEGTTLANSSVSVQGAFNINPLAAPPAIGGFTLSAGTNLGVGQYYYRVVYVTALGETNASLALSVVTTTGNTTVNLTGIPVSSDPRVTARKLYRTTLNQSIDAQKFLATINNNTTTTYTDSATDASLTGVALQAYKVNTTARYFTVSGTQGMVIDANLTALGRNAGNAIIASSGAAIRTVLIGASAGQNITTGQANVIVGVAGVNVTTGGENTLIGDLAGYAVNTGYNNTIIGSQTGRYLTSGYSNIFIGGGAGSRLADGTTPVTTAFQNIAIGRNARMFTANDSNSIIIGDTALGLGSNTTVIGNSSTTFTSIPAGNMTVGGTVNAGYKLDVQGTLRTINDAYFATTSGNVGIGTTSPTAPLQVNGAGGDGAPTLRLISSASSTFNWASSAEYANLTAGETSIHLIGKANSAYNQAYFGYRHAADGSSSNMVTIGMYGANYLVNILGNGNVGIGTTSPASKLHVQGSGTVARLVSTGAYVNMYMINSTNSGFLDLDGSKMNFYVGGGAGGDLKMSITNTGNVGIGTTSPAQKLDVVGRVRASYDANNYYEIGASSSGGFVVGKNGGIETVNIRTYGDSHFTGGNVGIGTTSPGAKLDIDNGTVTDVRIRGNQTTNARIGAYNFYNTAASDTVAAISADRDGANDAGALAFDTQVAGGGMTERMRITSTGNVGIGTTSPAAKLQVDGAGYSFIAGYDSGNRRVYIGLDSAGEPSIQGTLSNGTARQISINPSGGNVGIGTTSPSYKLHVADSTASGRALFAYQTATSGTNYGAVLAAEGNGATKNVGLYATAQGATENYAALFDKGNVGIGTTSPNQKLEVAGRVRATTDPTFEAYNTSANRGGFQWVDGSLMTKIFSGGSSGAGAGIILETNTTEKMRITSAGNVGIGTASPISELQVNGVITATALVETSARRYKEDIKPLEPQLKKVNKLNPVTFTWKEDQKEDVGFIAEEMQEIFPELVSESSDGQVEGIQYSKLTAVLVKTLQEQQKQINDLKEEIFILKNSK